MEIDRREVDPRTVALAEGIWTAIADYQAGRLSLERLGWELMHRLAAIGDEGWARDLTAAWSRLEAVNDQVLTERRTALLPHEEAQVTVILEELRAALVGG